LFLKNVSKNSDRFTTIPTEVGVIIDFFPTVGAKHITPLLLSYSPVNDLKYFGKVIIFRLPGFACQYYLRNPVQNY
jgi:hypothetical protein